MTVLKTLVCLLWIIFVATIFLSEFSSVKGHSNEIVEKNIASNLKPKDEHIERFNNSIQKRFLTMPNFGIRRMEPIVPTSAHLQYFSPIDNDEKMSVAAFEEEDWDVSLFLFGRRAMPKIVNGKEQKKFSINYRLNKPLLITSKLKEKDLPVADKLLKQVKAAFLEFQTPDSVNENKYEFEIGKWSYVAKPVRAVNQSCLRCHTDYVITEKLTNNQYEFRERRIGDANGVVVYGFAKRN